MTATEAAAALGVSRSTLYSWFRRHGVRHHRGRISDATLLALARAREREEEHAPFTARMAARMLGVSPSRLYRVMRRHRIGKQAGVRRFSERIVSEVRAVLDDEVGRRRRTLASASRALGVSPQRIADLLVSAGIHVDAEGYTGAVVAALRRALARETRRKRERLTVHAAAAALRTSRSTLYRVGARRGISLTGGVDRARMARLAPHIPRGERRRRRTRKATSRALPARLTARAAAAHLGVEPTTLYRVMARHGIRKPKGEAFRRPVVQRIQRALLAERQRLTPARVARTLGLTPWRLRALCKSAGVAPPFSASDLARLGKAAARPPRQRITWSMAAEEVGVSRTGLQFWIERLGIPAPGRRGFSAEAIAKVRAAREAAAASRGLSADEVAERLGLTRHKLWEHLRRSGLKKPAGPRKFDVALVEKLKEKLAGAR